MSGRWWLWCWVIERACMHGLRIDWEDCEEHVARGVICQGCRIGIGRGRDPLASRRRFGGSGSEAWNVASGGAIHDDGFWNIRCSAGILRSLGFELGDGATVTVEGSPHTYDVSSFHSNSRIIRVSVFHWFAVSPPTQSQTASPSIHPSTPKLFNPPQ